MKNYNKKVWLVAVTPAMGDFCAKNSRYKYMRSISRVINILTLWDSGRPTPKVVLINILTLWVMLV